jgi:capsular polysaccharide biosynthesis protein
LIESSKQVDGLFDVSIYTFLRELFLSRIKNNFDTTEYNKIYIRRDKSHLCEGNLADSSARRRQIINEQELVDKLLEIGIKSIYFEDYTVEQKIQIFRDASLVVAPQSGGLVFTLFGQQNADIVEIYPPNPHQYCDHYINICGALDIPFRRFVDVTKVDYYDNMIVNPEQLVNFILGK